MAKRRWIRDPLTVVVTALAGYRVTRLVTADHFPPVRKARVWVEDRTPDEYAMVWTCPWCIGAWIAGAMTVAAEIADRKNHRDAFVLAAMPWALSAITGVLAEREAS